MQRLRQYQAHPLHPVVSFDFVLAQAHLELPTILAPVQLVHFLSRLQALLHLRTNQSGHQSPHQPPH